MVNSPKQDSSSQQSSVNSEQKLVSQDGELSGQIRVFSESSESIKAVAIYEIVKGIGALLGAGALWLWHRDLDRWLATATDSWQQYFGKLLAPQIDSVVQLAQQASRNWSVFLLLICVYISLRFIEAYGLWQDKTWAYWFSVIGYGIFIPVELYYIISGPFDWFKLGIFVLNIVIVVVVYRNMKQKGLI